LISAREYYEQFTEEELEDGDYTTYEEFLDEYGDWCYHLERDNELCG